MSDVMLQYTKDAYDIRVQKQIIYQKLKENGCRITSQRKIIIDTILRNSFSCVKEIHSEAASADPAIGIATVYRMIKTLEDLGAIDRKNLYRISYDGDCPMEDACRIQFQDKSAVLLSGKEWNAVVTQGLKSLGYLKNKKVDFITIKECTYSRACKKA